MVGLAFAVCCPQWGLLVPVDTALSMTTLSTARGEYLEEFIDIHGVNPGLRHEGKTFAVTVTSGTDSTPHVHTAAYRLCKPSARSEVGNTK
jgi:hypothetical protein